MRRATLTAVGSVMAILALTGAMRLAGDAGLRQKPKPVRGRNARVVVRTSLDGEEWSERMTLTLESAPHAEARW